MQVNPLFFLPKVPVQCLYDDLGHAPIVTRDTYDHYVAQVSEMLNHVDHGSPPAPVSMVYALLLSIGNFQIENGLATLEHWGELLDHMVLPAAGVCPELDRLH